MTRVNSAFPCAKLAQQLRCAALGWLYPWVLWQPPRGKVRVLLYTGRQV